MRTPTQRAAVDIAELKRALYEARLVYKAARNDAENKELRIAQIVSQIDELQAVYPQSDDESKTTHFVIGPCDKPKPAETVQSILREEIGRAKAWKTGGFVGKPK